jgi:dipeptidyl aminopeptidase/acylaminoacyl peptidase
LGKGAGEKKKTRTNHFGALAAVVGMLGAVGLLVLIVVEVRPAEATFPGKNGKIAYSRYDGHDYEIYTIYPGGGGRVQLTDNNTRDETPSYSPNGKKIAYVGHERGHDREIYTRDATNGGGRFQVTHNQMRDEAPSWSPDGKRIAYYSGFAGSPGTPPARLRLRDLYDWRGWREKVPSHPPKRSVVQLRQPGLLARRQEDSLRQVPVYPQRVTMQGDSHE